MKADSHTQETTEPASTPASLFELAHQHHQHGAFPEATAAVKQALQGFYKAADEQGQLQCLLLEGRILRDQGDFQKAQEIYSSVKKRAAKGHFLEQEIDAHNLLASVIRYQGHHLEAINLLKEALLKAKEHDLVGHQANLLGNIGTIYYQLSNYPEALQHLSEASDLYRQIGSVSRDGAINQLALGSVYLELDEVSKAQSFFEKALEISQLSEVSNLEAVAFNNLASTYVKQENWLTAQQHYQEALVLARKLGAKHYEIDNLDGLGNTYSALQQHNKAISFHKQALTIAHQIEDHEGQKDALYNLGRDYHGAGQQDLALDHLHQALALASSLEHRKTMFECHLLLSTIYKQQGEYQLALKHHEAYHATERSIFNADNEEKTRQLSVKFDLERARFEADEYKTRIEFAQQARKNAQKLVAERTRELEDAQLEVVTRLAVAAEYRDDDTGEHTRRVGRNAAAIAHVLGWPEADVQLIYLASRLHDIGKIGIKDGILLKPGKLTDEEFELMRGHSVIGARILSNGHSKLLQLAEEIALAHHERWDGRGYPFHLQGEDIPMSARIVAVADVLDALSHERPYKRAWSVEETLEEIKQQAGKQFDPSIVEACMHIFETHALSPLNAPDSWQATLAELANLSPLADLKT